MRYKKRTPAPTSKGHQKKNRSSSISATPESPSHRRSTIPDDAAPLLSSNSSALLTVPTQMAMRKRSGSMPAFKLATLAAFWNLKKEHVRALRMTWARLCEPPRSNCRGIVNLVERVWEKLDSGFRKIHRYATSSTMPPSLRPCMTDVNEGGQRDRSPPYATIRTSSSPLSHRSYRALMLTRQIFWNTSTPLEEITRT